MVPTRVASHVPMQLASVDVEMGLAKAMRMGDLAVEFGLEILCGRHGKCPPYADQRRRRRANLDKQYSGKVIVRPTERAPKQSAQLSLGLRGSVADILFGPLPFLAAKTVYVCERILLAELAVSFVPPIRTEICPDDGVNIRSLAKPIIDRGFG